MAKPAVKDIDVVRGDSFDMYLGVGRNGTRIDLTGATVTGEVRATIDSPTADGTFVCTLADQGTDAGGVVCTLTKEVTVLFNFTTAVYDIQIDFANGDRTTVVGGKVTLIKDVTRGA